MKCTLTILLSSASLLAMAAPAAAQAVAQAPAPVNSAPPADATQAAAPNSAVSEIIVTAQRRAEKVTDVPISITVANQAQLERQHVVTINDLQLIAPSLEIQAAPGQNVGGGAAIRGIGTQTFSEGAVPSVGIVVDQVSQGNANLTDLFDIARVEVLKGPQGTLFGLTTSAGVINITTNAPDPTHYSARLHTDLSGADIAGSDFGNQVVQGMVNLPLSDDAALRISGVSNTRQGPDANILTGHDNEVDDYAGRARILWKPQNNLTINLIGDYSRQYLGGSGDFFTFTKADPTVTSELAQCGITPKEGNRYYCTNEPLSGASSNFGVSLEVDYDPGPVTLSSISAYRGYQQRGDAVSANVYRVDPLDTQIKNGEVHNNINLFTQEFRVASPGHQFIDYTAGVFLSHQGTIDQPFFTNVDIYPAPGVDIPADRSMGSRYDVLDESAAAFGEMTLHATSHLRLIAGGRYTAEKLRLDQDDLDIPANPNSTQQYNASVISYRFGAQYDLTQRAMAYVTTSRGYKGAQIAIPTNSNATPYVLRPEIPTDYEGGVKATLFGGWVADLNVFYTKIKDFQDQQCADDPVTLALSCVQTNINGVETRGAELDFFGSPLHGLMLNTGFIYAKATYPNGFIGTDGSDLSGHQLANSPRYKFTFSGEYEHPVTEQMNGFLAVDTVWKSRVAYENDSYIQSTYRPHWIVGGRFGVRTPDDHYSLGVFVRNLFNEHEPVLLQSGSPNDGANNIAAQYGPNSFRQVGLSLDARY